MSTGNDDKRRAADGDDLPPSGREARAQRKATSMPLIWFIVGLALIGLFVVVISRSGGLFHTPAAGPSPVKSAHV